MTAEPGGGFAARVVRWHGTNGRHDLPWQGTRDPYRVWLSEIMLQQTQVSTVLTYYGRFLQRFPDVAALAAASQDEVMGLWSGLGYYSRARNLHRCARVVVQEHGGRFPASAQALEQLPGIGRSTAAAIAAFCFGERVAILDGNVKRVLARALAFADDLALAANEARLWQLATELLPGRYLARTMPAYTQGLMDLGATVCTRRQPACERCPLVDQCQAHLQQRTHELPVKTRRVQRRDESLWLLWAQQGDGSVWLEQRPPKGIWAALHCLPVFASEEGLREALPKSWQSRLHKLEPVRHELTHRSLLLHPCRVAVQAAAQTGLAGQWVAANRWPELGLPAPIRRLLQG
jgi:A/G-specific adenine glycosylase